MTCCLEQLFHAGKHSLCQRPFSQDEKHIIAILDASGTSEKWDIESSALLDPSEGNNTAAALEPSMSRAVVSHHCFLCIIHDED